MRQLNASLVELSSAFTRIAAFDRECSIGLILLRQATRFTGQLCWPCACLLPMRPGLSMIAIGRYRFSPRSPLLPVVARLTKQGENRAKQNFLFVSESLKTHTEGQASSLWFHWRPETGVVRWADQQLVTQPRREIQHGAQYQVWQGNRRSALCTQ